MFESVPTSSGPGLHRTALAFARSHALTLRVVVAILISLAFLLFASEAFFTRAASRELIQQEARSYVADARALETAQQEGSDPADALDDVLDLVDSIEDRLGIVSAELLDAGGQVVSAPRDANLGSDRGAEHPLHLGPSYDDVVTREKGRAFEFVVPIRLNGDRFQLRVEEDGAILHDRIDAVRTEALVFSVVSLLVGMGLFYALGGRMLARRHSLVVKRATRDPLTDLGNHRSFQEELARALAVATRQGEPLALALVDLDDLKSVNDRFGHRRGDEVLVEVARVLEHGRGVDRAFRIGGDEFALLLPGLDCGRARDAVARRADARADGAATPFTAGVATVSPGEPIDPTVLWEQADAALYEGKRSGGSQVVVFDDFEEPPVIVTPAKTQALRALLRERRLETVFQPIMDLHDGQLLGLEALARPWKGYGFEGPAEMFEVAEKLGRAPELDNVCRAAALARANELPDDVLLFLNVSPQSLTHGTLTGDGLQLHAVVAAGLDPAQVVLEITERSDVRLSQVIAGAIRLHRLGFRLALDDVGAGNAGLEMLRQLPVDYVKIDRSVIVAATDDTHAQAVLLAVIAYARCAQACVIAECIETEQILSFVRNARELQTIHDAPITGGQGYLLGHPSSHIPHDIVAFDQGLAA